MNSKNKIHTIFSAFFLLSLILLVFFIWLLLKDIGRNSSELILAKNDITALGDQINEVEKFKQNFNVYKSNFELIDKLFVDLNNPVDFIEFLENTASNYNITSQISLPPATSGYQQSNQNFIILQFSSKGKFLDVLNFVKKIEAGPYLLENENLDIQNSQDKNISNDYSSRIVSAVFNLKIFIKK